MKKTLRYNVSVFLQEILNGGITTLPPSQASLALCDYARDIVETYFRCNIQNISHKDYNVDRFIAASQKAKSEFTESDITKNLTRSLIESRYPGEDIDDMYFDKPRLRIIPNSKYLSSGISYNYKPHRDTWYGGPQRQVNHWMTLSNVTPDSTFYIAPYYFDTTVENNSEVFDLDTWDKNYRNKASVNVKSEERPHPLPLEDIPDDNKYLIVLPQGAEVVFSSHHIHGSFDNTTDLVRFSIDYRTVTKNDKYIEPYNLDKKATGTIEDYMLKVKE